MMGLMDKELLFIELPENDRHVTVHDVSDGGANQGLVKVGERVLQVCMCMEEHDGAKFKLIKCVGQLRASCHV